MREYKTILRMATSLILSALALLLLVLGGCSGVSKGNVTTPASRPAGQPAAPAQEQPDVTPVGFAGALPPPSDLAGQLDVPRQASLYTELDLIKHGKDFDAALPHNNDAVSSNSVEFSPSWSEAAGMTMDNLGYCIYQFQIPGYDRSPEVRYGWEEPPTDIGTAWFGLADWDLDRWVWFQGKVDGVLTTPSFDPFISSTDVLLAVVVLANDEVSKLRYVRLGPLVLHPYIQASPKVGLPPLEVNFNASGSTVDVGTIVNYEWDLDGDGTYEQDTGLTATASHTYGDTGEFTATVRVTSSYGVQATASDTVKGVAPWIHSWGGSKYEEILRIAFDGGDHLYAIGNTFSYGAGNFDLLLLKYTVEGELVWAKAWGGPINDAGRDLAFDGNGNLITLGHTYSYGSGRSDVLVQKWTSEGEVLWSRTWGGVEHEFVDAVAVSAGAIYVLAQTESYGDGNGDILLLKYDLDGNLLWARTWGGPGIDDPKDMQTVYNFIAGTTTFLITGSTTSYGGGNHDVLYLRFTESGDVCAQRTWGDSDFQVGTCISASGILGTEVYIAGIADGLTNNNDEDVLLLEVGTGGNLMAKTWGGNSYDRPDSMLMSGGNLILSGSRTSIGNPADGLLLSFSTDGGIQSAEVWDRQDDSCRLYGLSYFPGGGILISGYGEAAQDGAWTAVAGTLANANSLWVDQVGTITNPVGTIASPTGTLTDITEGVIDTGGGDDDALLMLRKSP